MNAILYRDKVYGAGGSGGGGGASAISELTDVDLDNLSDGQILKWNDTTQKWENADESGGGGGTTLDVLFNNSGTSNPSTITLQKPLTDYDFIITHIKSSGSGRATIGYIYTVNSMAVGDIIGGELAAGNGWIWYTYTNATTLTYLGVAQAYYIKSICGVKLGSGGGGGGGSTVTITPTLSSGTKIADFEIDGQNGELYAPQGGGGGGSYTRTELFKSSDENAVWNASGIALSDDIENYDELEIIMGFANAPSDRSRNSLRYDAKWFANTFPYVSDSNANPHALCLLWAGQGFSCGWDSANQKIRMYARNGAAAIWAVYGIKY